MWTLPATCQPPLWPRQPAEAHATCMPHHARAVRPEAAAFVRAARLLCCQRGSPEHPCPNCVQAVRLCAQHARCSLHPPLPAPLVLLSNTFLRPAGCMMPLPCTTFSPRRCALGAKARIRTPDAITDSWTVGSIRAPWMCMRERGNTGATPYGHPALRGTGRDQA